MIWDTFCYICIKHTYFKGTHSNCLTEEIPVSNHKICFGVLVQEMEKKKKSSLVKRSYENW